MKKIIKSPSIIKKKFSKYNSSQLFAKYLISYVIVLAIPLLSLGILVYNYYSNALEKEVIKNSMSMLDHIQTSLDTKISELHTIAYQIYSNPTLTTYTMNTNPLDSKKGITELKNYIIGNKFINEVFVYYDKIGRTYSSSNTLSIKEFFTLYKYGNWDEDQFIQSMRSIDNITLRPSENVIMNGQDYNFVTYFVPNPNGSRFDGKMVFFLIDDKSITDILKNYRGNTVIFNKDGIISCLHLENYLETESLRSFIGSKESSSSTILNFEGTEYFVSFLKSEATEWTYVTFVPVKEAMHPVISAKLIFLYSFFFILIIASIVITFIMKLNYNPLKQLKIFAETKLGKTLSSINEIEAARLTIDQMSKTSEELNFKITSNRSAVKEFLLLNLLQGNYFDIGEFNEKGKEIGICFTNPFYQVVLISLFSSEPSKKISRAEIIRSIEENLPESFEGYGKNSIDGDKIILIFALSSEESIKEFSFYLCSIQDLLYKNINVQSTIGVGSRYLQLNEIGKSYIQATTALDYRLIRGKNKIIFFNEILPQSSFINEYPIDELDALELSIIEGNIDQISNIIANIINMIKNTDMPLFAARCLCYDIINAIIKSMCAVNKEFISIKKDYPDVISLTEFETVEELGDIVKRISHDMYTYIQENRNNQLNDLTHRMIEYIGENYEDYNFSIQGMADHFGMSLSNISHYFKRETNQTVSDYVDYLRIKKAKELLAESSIPLNEIVKGIGYVDTSSFVRKFKKFVGTTPGNYRKINQTE